MLRRRIARDRSAVRLARAPGGVWVLENESIHLECPVGTWRSGVRDFAQSCFETQCIFTPRSAGRVGDANDASGS